MKKSIRTIITLLLALALAMSMTACKKSDETEAAAEPAETQQEETGQEDLPEVVKTIDEIDTEGMKDEPLQIESITLYKDGSVRIVPMEDLLKNAETNDEIKDGAMYPFADIGKVKDIFLVRYGDEGYRTLICLMDDGTLAAMSAKELIEDRIAVVMPNMTGRDNYVSVEQTEDDGYYGVIGITEDEKEVELDFSLDF